jgi:hypothetical protein
MGASQGVAIAALSGLLSYAACYIPDWGTQWGAGIAFGLLVLGPTQRDASSFAAVVALSTAVYRVAVWIAVRLTVDTPVPAIAACMLAGALGAVALSFGAGTVRGGGFENPALRLAAIWGAVAGALIGIAVDVPEESIFLDVFLLAGFVAWQVGYTVSHRLAPWRRMA